jgi:hypothetical protein
MKTQKSFKQRATILFMIIPMLISMACLSSTAIPSATTSTPLTATSESGAASVEANVDFGTGPISFPDTKAGLTNLSSYKATLTLTFDGTETGQPQQWSKTYTMLAAKDPAARQLTIEKTGAEAELVFMAEMNGAAYERRGENDCIAMVIEEENSLSKRLEPASFLNGIIGADEAGNETVNDVAANHYTFDQRAFGQSNISQSTGEMWVAADGGYIVKYLLTTNGNADYFGEGIEGTITWDYELTDINQPLTITLPDNCPGGLVNAPLLPDASEVLNMPGLLTYHTSMSLADTAAFYQQEIPNLGWELIGEPTLTDTTALLDYIQADKTLTVIITADETGTTANVVLDRSQEAVPSP